jgi:hypothetical protein
VVRLALSIAGRVLRHEAEADPLLLSGAVRVALGQLSETAEVRLRVPAREESLWQEMIRLTPNLVHRPKLVADADMLTGECLLESSMGTIDLGLEAQLEEIERGFFEQPSNGMQTVRAARRVREQRPSSLEKEIKPEVSFQGKGREIPKEVEKSTPRTSDSPEREVQSARRALL